MAFVLQTENLSCVYGEGTPFRTVALNEINIGIEKGELLAVIGQTGSGKSSLIQHFNGILRPSSGRVLLNGQDIWADKKKYPSGPVSGGVVFPVPRISAL